MIMSVWLSLASMPFIGVFVSAETLTSSQHQPQWRAASDGSFFERSAVESPEGVAVGLPSSRQYWADVNSQAKLNSTLERSFTAIEADLLLGRCTSCSDTDSDSTPIIAHPPDTSSDLSTDSFLDQMSKPSPSNDGTRVLRRITKLDFKVKEVVELTLQMIVAKKIVFARGSENIFFLNADILPGPGNRKEGDVTMDPDVFIPTGLTYIQKQIASSSTTNLAWSLGFKASYEALDCYRREDFDSMDDVIRKYNLLMDGPGQGLGVVLALNARQLARQLDLVSSNFLPGGIWDRTTPNQLQILAWTGRNEPPLRQATVDKIIDHFRHLGLLERLGFDIGVVDNYLLGVAIDFGICVYGVAQAFINIFSC